MMTALLLNFLPSWPWHVRGKTTISTMYLRIGELVVLPAIQLIMERAGTNVFRGRSRVHGVGSFDHGVAFPRGHLLSTQGTLA